MDEGYLIVVLFLGIVSGYYLSKIAEEELDELRKYLKFSYAFTAALMFAVAAYYSIIYSIIAFVIVIALLLKVDNAIAQYAVLFVSGAVLFFAKDVLVFSSILFINLMIVASLNYRKGLERNIAAYAYFVIPSLILFLSGV